MASCTICGKHFSRAYDMKRHIREVHKINQPPQGQPCQDPSSPACPPTPAPPVVTIPQGTPGCHITTQPFLFRHPFSMVVAAPSGFGKTFWLKQLLQGEYISPAPDRIIWCYTQWQPLYDEMKNTIPNIAFYRGIPPNLDDEGFIDVRYRHLLIFDDLMNDLDQNITNLYTKGSHHRNLSAVTLVQNFYHPGTVCLRRNSHYIVLFNMPSDQQVIKTISQRMYPENPQYLLTYYHKATAQPFGHVIIDLKPETPNNCRLHMNLFDNKQGDQTISIPPEARKRCALPPHSSDLGFATADIQPCPDQYSHQPFTHTDSSYTQPLTHTDHSEMDLATCLTCGISFQSPRYLALHQSKGCGDETDYSDDENDAWCGLVGQAYGEHDPLYAKRVETLEQKGVTDAEEQVSDELRPKYLKSLTKAYTKFVQQTDSFNKNSTHNEIMKTIAWYECRGYDFEKALTISLRKKRHLLGDVLDDFLHKDDEEGGVEEGESGHEGEEGEGAESGYGRTRDPYF